MAYSRHLRAELRDQFVNRQHSLQRAARLIGVHITTARRWRDHAREGGDCWVRAKAQVAINNATQHANEQAAHQLNLNGQPSDNLTTPPNLSDHTGRVGSISHLAQQIAQQLIPEFKATIHQLGHADIDPIKRVSLLASVTDAHAKLINTVSKATPDTTAHLDIALATIKRLTQFVMAEQPDIAAQIVPVLEDFGRVLVKEKK